MSQLIIFDMLIKIHNLNILHKNNTIKSYFEYILLDNYESFISNFDDITFCNSIYRFTFNILRILNVNTINTIKQIFNSRNDDECIKGTIYNCTMIINYLENNIIEVTLPLSI